MRVDEAKSLISKYLGSFHMEDGSLIIHTLTYFVELEKGPAWHMYMLNPTVSWEDGVYVFMAFIGVMLLRLLISGGSSGSLRSFPCISKKFAKSLSLVRRGKLHKFGENVWYTLWHGVACMWGLYVLISEAGTAENPGWPRLHWKIPDGRWYWMASPEEESRGSGGWPLLLPTESTRNYYLFQLAFWFSCLAFINVETKRKDYAILFIHHVVTIILVIFSYLCSYWKIGLVVLVLHDMADVFLYLSKTLHYSRVKSGAVEISFGTFVAVYFVTRLIMFPIYCVRPTLNTSLIRELTEDFVSSRWRIPGATCLPCFLIILQVLHIYWFWCIVRMVVGLVKAIRNGNREDCEDIRSEDECEEEEEPKPLVHETPKKVQ